MTTDEHLRSGATLDAKRCDTADGEKDVTRSLGELAEAIGAFGWSPASAAVARWLRDEIRIEVARRGASVWIVNP